MTACSVWMCAGVIGLMSWNPVPADRGGGPVPAHAMMQESSISPAPGAAFLFGIGIGLMIRRLPGEDMRRGTLEQADTPS